MSRRHGGAPADSSAGPKRAMRTRAPGWSAALLLAGGALLPACAAEREPSTPTASAGTSLTVTLTAGSQSRDWTVTCDPAGGTHPRPKSACDFLELARRWGKDPFAPVPADAVCSQQYGGPQIATVKGTWNGRPIDATFNRTDGCEIARWDNAIPLLAINPNIDPNAPEPPED